MTAPHIIGVLLLASPFIWLLVTTARDLGIWEVVKGIGLFVWVVVAVVGGTALLEVRR